MGQFPVINVHDCRLQLRVKISVTKGLYNKNITFPDGVLPFIQVQCKIGKVREKTVPISQNSYHFNLAYISKIFIH